MFYSSPARGIVVRGGENVERGKEIVVFRFTEFNYKLYESLSR